MAPLWRTALRCCSAKETLGSHKIIAIDVENHLKLCSDGHRGVRSHGLMMPALAKPRIIFIYFGGFQNIVYMGENICENGCGIDTFKNSGFKK
jgi:hypothetical protein